MAGDAAEPERMNMIPLKTFLRDAAELPESLVHMIRITFMTMKIRVPDMMN